MMQQYGTMFLFFQGQVKSQCQTKQMSPGPLAVSLVPREAHEVEFRASAPHFGSIMSSMSLPVETGATAPAMPHSSDEGSRSRSHSASGTRSFARSLLELDMGYDSDGSSLGLFRDAMSQS